ncbi:MAG: hypothetical protein EZS28_001367 [Streblomastix strix]|uniref:Uncharacterized protein n=1 Tax=Streblomastix strix TaxID=222440 RepID=A0A5J4X797_9EUKA|nr:MAG: hypothetical protein EZS28_001367 [Streblomastix strix]
MKATYLQQAGTIEETLLGNAVVPFTNDGEHHYSIKEIKPESQMSALFDKEIIISLSDTDHDITQIQNSFLSVVLTANIQLDYKFEKIDESYKDGLVLFVGLKSGSNLVREYTIYHRGETIDGNLQSNATAESFIYNTIKPKRCSADLITGLHAEPLTESGLKNLICDIKPVTISIKNYVITEVTANMAGYKATDACLNRVRQFYSQRPFVVPAQRVEVWPFPTSATLTGIRTSQNIPLSHVTDFCPLFPKDARATTCFENPCYQYMQVTTCGSNFPDMPMNTIDQQFIQLQLNASILDLLFETTDEFDDVLTTPRNTATRKLNPHTDLTKLNTSVELRGASIYQGATDSYYNVDTGRKRLPLPILCTVHDTFWLFSPAAGGS